MSKRHRRSQRNQRDQRTWDKRHMPSQHGHCHHRSHLNQRNHRQRPWTRFCAHAVFVDSSCFFLLLVFFASPHGPFVTRSRCSGPCAYWFLHILPLEVLHSYRPPSPLHLHDYGQISVRPRSQQQQLRNKAGQKARPAYRQEFLGVYFPGPVSWLFFRWLPWWNFDAKMLELNMTEAHF